MSVLGYSQSLEKKYLKNQTYGYDGLISAYAKLDMSSNFIKWHTVGMTDNGEPLYVFELSNDPDGYVESAFNPSKLRILVLNGIHAGESDGIDASLHWVEELLKTPEIFEDVSIFIIPVYNVGGYQNMSCCTRANQNGPEPLGFRGNANNLDLNRDFMKCDAANTRSFQYVFQRVKPNLLIDTHTTNGADYQYVMTLLPGPTERFPKEDQLFLNSWVKGLMEANNKKVKTGPYVNVWGQTPEAGFEAFRQNANLSGGYAALFNVPAITLETHMFKPYAERVEATQTTLQTILESAINFKKQLVELNWSKPYSQTKFYPTAWKLDSTTFSTVNFKGFEAEFYTSPLTGQKTYHYNRAKPKTFSVRIYDKYVPADSIIKPQFYLLHFGQNKACDALERNGAKFISLKKDTIVTCRVQYVSNIKSAQQPYEGHFQHSNFALEEREISELFKAGDFLIEVNQNSNYIFEALEAKSEGSFFRWNFFDTYLQQKEWFSAYVFEEKAIAFLAENPEVNTEFEKKRAVEPAFAADHFAQLYWIYRQTPYYEKEHMRIPVFRVY
jgi:hypothetical protein